MTLDLPAIRARAEEARDTERCRVVPGIARVTLAVDEVDALLAEVERLSRNLEYASAECCDLSAYRQLVREEHPAEVAALTTEVERLREQLPRVARWVATELRPDLSPAEIDALVAEALEAPRG